MWGVQHGDLGKVQNRLGVQPAAWTEEEEQGREKGQVRARSTHDDLPGAGSADQGGQPQAGVHVTSIWGRGWGLAVFREPGSLLKAQPLWTA